MEIDVLKLLEQSGLKKTPQRVEVLKNLSQRYDHPTVDELHQSVSSIIPGLSIATLYKMLETFAECGLVERIMCEDGKLRYDFYRNKHHHIHNLDDGKITDYKDDKLDEMIWNYLNSKDFQDFEIKDITLQIKVKQKKL